MSLFSYPSTLPAATRPKTRAVLVNDVAGQGWAQFILESASRAFAPGSVVQLTDYEFSLISQAAFDSGLLTEVSLDGSPLSGVQTLSAPVDVDGLADGTVATFEAPVDGTLTAWYFVADSAGDGDGAVLTVEIDGDAVQTGGSDSELTLGAFTAGGVVAGDTPATANTFEAGDPITVVATLDGADPDGGAGTIRLVYAAT
jgi:hypothetical protein